MIVRPVIGSTTLLTIVISMKRTQSTSLLLSHQVRITRRHNDTNILRRNQKLLDFSTCFKTKELFDKTSWIFRF